MQEVIHIKDPPWLLRMDPYTSPPKYGPEECAKAMAFIIYDKLKTIRNR